MSASGRRGFVLPSTLLIVMLLVPLALATLALVSIDDRGSERKAKTFGTLYVADGATRVAAALVGATEPESRPTAPRHMHAGGEDVLVEPAGTDRWTFTASSGEGRALSTVAVTLLWGGGGWSLVDYRAGPGEE